MIKRNDIYLIIFLLAISLVPWAGGEREASGTVYITLQGQLYRRWELNSSLPPQKLIIQTDRGKNVIEVNKGAVSVLESDCADGICVKTGAISRPGEVIACLPHGLLIEIKSE